MSHPPYYFDETGAFVVEQYNDRAPFASFLPGIAGPTGVPAWAFYVNRGQAMACFGVRNKDGAMVEFFPADKAYQLTPSRGFRTFLKVSAGGEAFTHEPFQRGSGEEARQRLYITPHEVGVEEIHPRLELRIRADMFTLPEAPLAGLVRRVTVQNLSSQPRRVEIVDGLPQVLPYGMNQWCVKFMSRTVEAYMVVEGVAERSPFFRLKVLPTDTPQVEPVMAGNFFAGFLDGRRTQTVVDAEKIFGRADDFSSPERFYSAQPLEFGGQVTGNRTPSAFQALSLDLVPGEIRVFYGVYGQAPTWEMLQAFLGGITDAAWLEAKGEINRRLVDDLTQRAFTATAQPLFDAYARQCYLDNGLRGGFSMAVPGGKRLHLYGRKHGDLERDYNDFLVQDSPYSEGNGDFRDMLQNRRLDVWFDPALDARNIHYFFNLIQPDGYNPQVLRNSRFSVDGAAFPEPTARFPGLRDLLARPFKYGELWRVIRAGTDEPEPVIETILRDAREVEDAEFDRGYWSDHWTYLVDLLESYAAIFPERVADLFRERRYSFFDPTHFVLPRSRKHVLTPQGVRRFGAVEARPEKIALINSRTECPYRVRADGGTGAVVTTTLLGKIITLIANKLASLDPDGVGIEMEADRPGWCDALNGLPGLFGASVNETIELKRLADFTRHALADVDGECPLPVELAEFVATLETLLQRPALSADAFWEASQTAKEGYRDQVFMGFEGAETALAFERARVFLDRVSAYLDGAIAKARTAAGIDTYFSYEAVAFRETGNGHVVVTRFRRHPLPVFLEGFVHALRIAPPEEARTLYHAARNSPLFDRKLGMYRVNEPLGDRALALGRIGVFNDGWLENGSIFLHMHYKFVLEMVRRGLVAEFYGEIEKLLVPFRRVEEYRRNPIENSSFLVGSGFAIDAREHGRGCVARLSGATVEFLHLWAHLFIGPTPFVFEEGKLRFRPTPALSKALFSTVETRVAPFGVEEMLPRDSAACAFLGATLLVYINPTRRDTFGPDAPTPRRFQLYGRAGGRRAVDGSYLDGEDAEAVRRGQFRRVDVLLGD
ncbi:hypothetical protein [Methylomagnum sp.]